MYDTWDSRNTYKTVLKMPDEKRPPGRPRSRRENNNKMYCK
jgi:hypothetical protein